MADDQYGNEDEFNDAMMDTVADLELQEADKKRGCELALARVPEGLKPVEVGNPKAFGDWLSFYLRGEGPRQRAIRRSRS